MADLRKNIYFHAGIVFLFIAVLNLYGETSFDFRGDQTINYFSRYTEITLESERVQYQPGEDIPVKFRITNAGYQVIRIYPSSEPNRSFQFLVLDMQGREVESGDSYKKRPGRHDSVKKVVTLQGEPVKEIILHPEETYEKILYLNDIYALQPGQEYRISGYFYPDARHSFFTRSMNQIKLRITADARRDFLTDKRYFNVNPEHPSLSPEETVYLFLSAEMKKNWPNYLKYLELNKYITSYDRYATRYAAASEMERPAILKEFSEYLTGGKSEKLKRFRIVKIKFDRSLSGRVLDGGRSYVMVQAERDTRGFVERFEYTYSLERSNDREGFWQIVHVTARLLD